MDLHTDLDRLAARHHLGTAAQRELAQLAGLADAPADLHRRLPPGVAVLAALLGGGGLICWIAANWDLLGRTGQFTLLQLAVALPLLATLRAGPVRLPAALAGLLAVGALLAYFGQTYQTGADPWQLFALWAALALPLVLALRHDGLWTPWTALVLTAVALWLGASLGLGRAHMLTRDAVWPLTWAVIAGLTAVLQRLGLQPVGPASTRAAVGLAAIVLAVAIGVGALWALFASPVRWPFALGLLLAAGGVAWFHRAASYHLVGLCALALTLDTLMVAGLTRLLFATGLSEPILLSLGVLGLSAWLLGWTGRRVLERERRARDESAPAVADADVGDRS